MDERDPSIEVPATIGALLVLVGAFAPAADVDIYGDVSYVDIGGWPATVLVIGAVVALALVFLRRRRGFGSAVLLVWAALLWPWIGPPWSEDEPDNPLLAVGQTVVDGVTGFASDVATDVVLSFTDISWGVFVMLAGCLAMSWAAWRGSRRQAHAPDRQRPTG